MARPYVIEIFNDGGEGGASLVVDKDFITKKEADDCAEDLRKKAGYWQSVEVRKIGFIEQFFRNKNQKQKQEEVVA